jgi:AcrR family transcriptional regulator
VARDQREPAKVSRRTFYEHFADKEDCFVATYEAIAARARKHVLEGYDPSDSWADQVRTIISRLLEFMAADHAFARVIAVEPLTAGGRALEVHSATTRKTIPLIERGRAYAKRPDELPRSTEEAIAGTIGSIAYWHVVAGQSEKLTDLLPDFLYYVLAPYLGHDVALAESRKS